jgi:hypothetical protein
MSGCGEIKEDLSAYLDGVLDVGRRDFIRAHLETCTGCNKAYDSLEHLQKMMRTLPCVEPPVGFLDQLNRRLPAPSFIQRVGRWISNCALLRPILKIAAVSAAGFLIFLIVNTQKEDRQKAVSDLIDTRSAKEIKLQAPQLINDKGNLPGPLQDTKQKIVLSKEPDVSTELTLILFREYARSLTTESPLLPNPGRRLISESGSSAGLKQDSDETPSEMESVKKDYKMLVGSVRKDKIKPDRASEPDIGAELRLQIKLAGGRILFESAGRSEGEYMILDMEIPGKRVETFFKNLERFGTFHNLWQEKISKNHEMIRIRVRIVSR